MVPQRETLSDPAEATFDLRADGPAEWLLTDGHGGFAMGTPVGANTRRYHGLAVLAARPPLDRVVALHSVIEQVERPRGTCTLTHHLFGEDAEPHPGPGASRCVVRLPAEAQWHFTEGDIRLERTLTLERGGVARLVYRVQSSGEGLLRLRPLLPLRRVHDLDGEPHAPHVERWDRGGVTLVRDGVKVRLEVEEGDFRLEPETWRDFSYPEDRARGQPWQESVFSPGVIEHPLAGGAASIVFSVGLEPRLPVRPRVTRTPLASASPALVRLQAAADQFIVSRGDRTSIIAGYPWFADWGRDALISLPGLLLDSGRRAESRAVLETFAASERDGLLPNHFDDAGRAAYHAADAPLWFVWAVEAYRVAGGENRFRDFLATSRRIIAAYEAGTSFDIGLDDDGLVYAGDGERAVTWMDAARDGVLFTPRIGKPVEINALWLYALRVVAGWLGPGREARHLKTIADRAAAAFGPRFWWPERGCLRDVVDAEDPADETRLRPNQIFALSLGAPLTASQQASTLAVVEGQLLTPYGLRTLEPSDPSYDGRFEGDMAARDGAYHNGTVWPWLLAPLGEARQRVRGPSGTASLPALAGPLIAALDHRCVGQVSEVYDGDPPHRPGGCPAQAWSVAALIRLVRMSG